MRSRLILGLTSALLLGACGGSEFTNVGSDAGASLSTGGTGGMNGTGSGTNGNGTNTNETGGNGSGGNGGRNGGSNSSGGSVDTSGGSTTVDTGGGTVGTTTGGSVTSDTTGRGTGTSGAVSTSGATTAATGTATTGTRGTTGSGSSTTGRATGSVASVSTGGITASTGTTTGVRLDAGGCTFNGQQYPVGASVPSPDGCNNCSCTVSGVACTTLACVPPDSGADAHPTACDAGADPTKRYLGTPTTCPTIKFSCSMNEQPFTDSCGCGCQTKAPACEITNCFRNVECVDSCGGPDVSNGCCACVPPAFDKSQCAGDARSSPTM